ncbi:MAG: oligosaccharide flippase family protein, partial [Clostridia bacterium]|nr:oligosaccharide flippase family protein [Clostridia bacterium]
SGIGLLQLVMAVYGLVITFAGAGVKLGATRLVTDAITSGKNSVQQIMSICFRYSLAVGIGVCIVLYLFSGMISKEWIGDSRTESSLKILALSLPPISVSAALNGYFTAKKTMLKYSVVQLSEQLIKIIITVVSLKLFGNTGLSYACCAIAAGITAAEISSAFIAYIIYRKGNNKQNNHTEKQSILKRLLHICVPDVTGAGFRSILLTIEHLLIPQGFKKSGQSNEQAMSIYGTIHAMALPIVLYPSAVLTSLSSLLVPELSRYKLFNDTKKIGFAASTAIKITLIFSIAVATFMCFFSDNISTAIYSDLQASFYIKLLSVLIPVMYTDMITDGLLKGLDQQSASMRYNIFDSAICVVLVYFLLPKYSIKG